MKQTLLVAMIVFSTVSVAHAGGQAGSIGIGAELQLSGLGGLSANYDAGKFHLGGFVAVDDQEGGDNTQVDLGGRFFFHVASSSSSDFSIGGSLGIRSDDPGVNLDRTTEVFIEPSFQIRTFLSANVALSFAGGFVIGAADASGLEITGDFVGTGGVHYYFF